MKTEFAILFIINFLFIDIANAQQSLLNYNYEIEQADYGNLKKPMRKNFRWLSKIGFDSIAVEAGFNNRQHVEIYKYPDIPCDHNCNPVKDVYSYNIINYHIGLSSYDFLSEKIILLKGISLLREKYARDYVPVYGPQVKHYSEWSKLRLQFPIMLGYKTSNIYLLGGISLNTYKFNRNEGMNYYGRYLNRDTDFDFSVSPAMKFGYMKKFKKITAGVYTGADLIEKYNLFTKLGFQVVIF